MSIAKQSNGATTQKIDRTKNTTPKDSIMATTPRLFQALPAAAARNRLEVFQRSAQNIAWNTLASDTMAIGNRKSGRSTSTFSTHVTFLLARKAGNSLHRYSDVPRLHFMCRMRNRRGELGNS